MLDDLAGRWRFLALVGLHDALVVVCLANLWTAGDLSLRRNLWHKLLNSAAEFSRPRVV